MKKILLLSLALFSLNLNSISNAEDLHEHHKIEKSTHNNFSDSINYSNEKFQMKKLFDSDKFEVVGFVFSKGQELKEHTTKFDAFLYIVEGEASIVIDKKENILKTGDFIKLPANIPHAVKSITNFKMILTKPITEKH